jgi:hypothetical protein
LLAQRFPLVMKVEATLRGDSLRDSRQAGVTDNGAATWVFSFAGIIKKAEACYASAFLFAMISVIIFFTLQVNQVPQEPVVQDYPPVLDP